MLSRTAVPRKPALLPSERNSVLTSIFADARFFLMTLFSEYCSVAMMACATTKGEEIVHVIGSRRGYAKKQRAHSQALEANSTEH